MEFFFQGTGYLRPWADQDSSLKEISSQESPMMVDGGNANLRAAGQPVVNENTKASFYISSGMDTAESSTVIR